MIARELREAMSRVLTLPPGDVMLDPTPTVRWRLRALNARPVGAPHGRRWATVDGLSVIASIDDTPRFGPLLHVSLAWPDRNPTWGEITAVRGAFFPRDVDAMMVMPRAEDYVNVHAYCFHLWQTPTEWGMR